MYFIIMIVDISSTRGTSVWSSFKLNFRRRLLNDKCEEYSYNDTQPETMEWFDNPDFFGL